MCEMFPEGRGSFLDGIEVKRGNTVRLGSQTCYRRCDALQQRLVTLSWTAQYWCFTLFVVLANAFTCTLYELSVIMVVVYVTV